MVLLLSNKETCGKKFMVLLLSNKETCDKKLVVLLLSNKETCGKKLMVLLLSNYLFGIPNTYFANHKFLATHGMELCYLQYVEHTKFK